MKWFKENDKTKELALQCILFGMEAVKINLEISTKADETKVNTEAMKTLAEAFKMVAGS